MPQKNIILPRERFKDTEQQLVGGNSTPIVTVKETKSNKSKNFALKKFNSQETCALEKLSYDLLELCGVKVPKTYILPDEKGNYSILVSRIEPGYKDLLIWMGGELNAEVKRVTFNIETHKESFPKQYVLAKYTSNNQNKPIIGLYENVGVFAFLGDWDAVGNTLQNVGLLEYDKYCQLVKIDPEYCNYGEYDSSGYGFKQYLTNLTKLLNRESGFFYWGDRGKNTEIFQYSSPKQVMDGMDRVSTLSNEALHSVIFNKKIPNLSQEVRDNIFKVLTTRRDAYKQVLNSKKELIDTETADELHKNSTKHSSTKNSDVKSSQTAETHSLSISMMVLSGFIGAAGIAAVAIAFTVLNAATFGVAGLVVAGIGIATALSGVGLFAMGAYKNRQTTSDISLDFSDNSVHQ
ncbi:hypothetical protein [Legionella fallonii]|nr:hypothetical protein [Legionella fallonii]